MTTTETTRTEPYRSQLPVGPDRFSHLVRAEWTKFRTVRGWMIGLVSVALVTLLFGLLTVQDGSPRCDGPGCAAPIGPEGQTVVDRFAFVHQTLDGDGSITVRVESLSGLISSMRAGEEPTPATEPWAKAGLIIKDGTTPGSSYAAIMITGAHGVRMQYDYTHDQAGSDRTVSPSAPRWLRLVRSGVAVTGYESADGVEWREVATVHLADLPSTVEVGLFVTSPEHEVTTQRTLGVSSVGGPTQATGVFAEVDLEGDVTTEAWTGPPAGDPNDAGPDDSFEEADGQFTIRGSGDIAPAVGGPAPNTIESALVGTFAALIGVIILGTMFMTAEYRRGLIRTTLTADPRRGRVLAAKALVLGGVSFVTGLVAAAATVPLVGLIRRNNGFDTFHVTTLTEVRVIIGTAALLAVAAVFALAVGTVLRRSAATVTTGIVCLVLPYLLAVASVLPAGPADWVLRITPAAAFAIQQSVPEYAHVSAAYLPSSGYFPLPPWGGFAVLCGWAALALGLAFTVVRRRDA